MFGLSAEPVNRGRQPELDLAKFISVLLMVGCHAGMAFFDPSVEPLTFLGVSLPYTVAGLMGGEFSAPVFMVCLGIGSVYSRNSAPGQLVRRGLRLFICGYLFNFICETLPALIGQATGYTYTVSTVFETVMVNEILTFAGLAFMALGLFKKLQVRPVCQLLLAVLFNGLGEILAFQSTGNYYLDNIFLLFWGTCENAHFTFLNWYIFVAAGAVFGQVLQRCTDKTSLYRKLFPLGLLGVFISYWQIVADYRIYYGNDGNFFFMGIKVAVLALFYPMLLFSVCYFLTRKIGMSRLPLVSFCSRNVTSIYAVSWVITMWARFIVQDVLHLSPDTRIIIVGTVIVFICTVCLVRLYNRFRAGRTVKTAGA